MSVAPLDAAVDEQLRGVGTATLATVLFKHGFRTRVVRSVQRLRLGGSRMVGVARTLRYVAMREDLDTLAEWKKPSNPQRAIADAIAPGEVLMIEAREDATCGTMGGMLVARIMVRGAAGIVSDGPFRDGPFIAALDLPSYANGMNANTNLLAHHPEELDGTITVGGVLVRPGDVVVGDDESVVVIPRHLVTDVAAAAAVQEREETWIEAQILAGRPVEGTYPMSDATRAAYEADSATDPAVGGAARTS